MATPITLPVTFLGSRKKMLLLLAISLVFVTIGVLAYEDSPLITWLTGGFFGLGALVALISLHPRASYLTLSESGFEFASLFRRHFTAWSDVDVFIPITISGNQMVGWIYGPGFSRNLTARGVSFAISGTEAALPDTYGYSNTELARLMNELRDRYTAS